MKQTTGRVKTELKTSSLFETNIAFIMLLVHGYSPFSFKSFKKLY